MSARCTANTDKNKSTSFDARTDNDLGEIDNRIRSLASAIPSVGTVIRTGVGSYDCLVAVGDRQVPCLMINMLDGRPFGYSNTDLPKEGSNVVVVTDIDASGLGYIFGTVGTRPVILEEGDENADLEDGEQQAATEDEILDQNALVRTGPNRFTEEIYSDPLEKNDGLAYYSGDLKPADVFPGEFVRVNEHGVGIDCDMLSASIRGGGSSRIMASRVDNTVEIVAGNFRQFDVSGTKRLSVDAGCITEESVFSEYVGERKGGTGLKADKKKHTEDEKLEDRPVGKYRLRSFIGYLGSIISYFISRPEKNTEETKEEDLLLLKEKKPKNTGLLHLNVNDNGRVLLRSAGGFALERSDRIPVPIRIRDMDDPEGIDSADLDKEDELQFEMPEDDDGNQSPHYTPIALADKMAYDYRQAYARFLEHMTEEDRQAGDSGDSEQKSTKAAEDGDGDSEKSDFYLLNEEDVDTPENDAGIPDRKIKPDELEANVGRRSGIYNLPDGSIIIRDAWGSELIFSGGNVTINTPGSVFFNTGYSLVTHAGDDIVLKARNSIDVDTTLHDITIHGDKSVKIVAGSDDSPSDGGVLIESFSFNSEVDFTDKGEDTELAGIVLKANDSHVSVLAKKEVLSAADEVRIVTGAKEKNKRSGTVSIATTNIQVATAEGLTLSAGKEGSGMVFSDNNATIIGESMAFIAKDGVTFATNDQVGVPLWLDIDYDMTSNYFNLLKDFASAAKDDSLNYPVNDSVNLFKKHGFSFRDSKQCHTLTGIELTDTPDNFMMYQPYWTVMAELEVGTMKEVETEKWKMHTVDGEYPWPGTDAVKNGHYAKLDHEDDETLNQKKITVKVSKDGEGNNNTGEKTTTASDDDLDILCAKEYDKIKGNKDAKDGDRVKIKLEKIDEYIVPVVSDQEDTAKSKKDSKKDKKSDNTKK